MRKLVGLLFCLSVFQCQNPKKQQIDTPVNYPILLDGGKKRIEQRQRRSEKTGQWEVYLDTITVSKGELYRNAPDKHPLNPFYLSYPEWETIDCIIAIDRKDYWDKAMIGLVEKAGTLRIKYRDQLIRLKPITPHKIREGDWSCVFKNDTISIELSAKFAHDGLFCAVGNARVTIGNRIFREEDLYFVVHEE